MTDLQSIRPTACQFAPVTNSPHLPVLANQLTAGKYGANWYPVLPAELLTFYWTLSLHCLALHCVQKKTPTHIFFHISMYDVQI